MQKFPLKKGLSSAQGLHNEINEYIDVLMGHMKPPIADGVDIILLDNMSIDQINKSINIIGKNAMIEASGNVSLKTVESIAKTGVDYISIGQITHSAPSVDIGLDIK